jgi:hypothetical protein
MDAAKLHLLLTEIADELEYVESIATKGEVSRLESIAENLRNIISHIKNTLEIEKGARDENKMV